MTNGLIPNGFWFLGFCALVFLLYFPTFFFLRLRTQGGPSLG